MKNKSLGYDAALSEEAVERDEDWVIRLGFLVHDVARLRRTVIDETFKPLSVTRSQAWLMAYLSKADGLTQSALAEQMDLGKVALGGLIDRLEKNEMIERRADPDDRRMNMIYITTKGKRVVKAMRKLTIEANKGILKGISDEEVRLAAIMMGKMKKNLTGMIKD